MFAIFVSKDDGQETTNRVFRESKRTPTKRRFAIKNLFMSFQNHNSCGSLFMRRIRIVTVLLLMIISILMRKSQSWSIHRNVHDTNRWNMKHQRPCAVFHRAKTRTSQQEIITCYMKRQQEQDNNKSASRDSSSTNEQHMYDGATNSNRIHAEGPLDADRGTVEEAFTSFILRIGYDGFRFTGWSSANDPKPGISKNNISSLSTKQHRTRKRSLRRGGMHMQEPPLRGSVRSVEGILRNEIAKIYGNIDPNRIVVIGCSRTDKGVHARSMIAQVYGLRQPDKLRNDIANGIGNCNWNITEEEDSINATTDNTQRHRPPHPSNATDASYFLQIPMNNQLTQIAYALNKMLPPDIRIVGISPTPFKTFDTVTGNPASGDVAASNGNALGQLIFHPTFSTISKTYQYTFSIEYQNTNHDADNYIIHDPTPQSRRFAWHHISKVSVQRAENEQSLVQDSDCSSVLSKPQQIKSINNESSSKITKNSNESDNNKNQKDENIKLSFDMTKVQQACRMLEGTYDFSSFKCSPRKRRRQGGRKIQQAAMNVCTLKYVNIADVSSTTTAAASKHLPDAPSSPVFAKQYKVTITGNRFLYKMVRFIVGALVSIGTGYLDVEDIQRALFLPQQKQKRTTDVQAGSIKTMATDFHFNKQIDTGNNISAPFSTGEDISLKDLRPVTRFPCAPAHGLILQDVNYGDNFCFDWKPIQGQN